MEDVPTSPTSLVVSSPRRTLSLVRDRNRSSRQPSFSHDPPSFHGTKPSEVYGFVGSITTVIAILMYLLWAYIPEPWLHSLGITYYPSKYWATAVPAFAMVTIVLGIVFYVGLNFMVTPPPTSFATMFDEYSRERPEFTFLQHEHPIEPICDIGTDHINDLMFGTLVDNDAT